MTGLLNGNVGTNGRIYIFALSVDTFDRRNKKCAGRTDGLYKQSEGLLIGACCLGIWWDRGVSSSFEVEMPSFPYEGSSPLLGGSFSRPHEHFPNFFGGTFWKEYPYFLPCLIASSYVAFSFLIALLYFKEVRIYITVLSLCLTCFRLCQSVRKLRKGLLMKTKISHYLFVSSWYTL